MGLFRVQVCKDNKRWCSIDVEHLDAGTVVRDVAGRFSAEEGFVISVQKRTGEKRLLESSPTGVKLIAVEPLFEKVSFD
ncbi:MULTISPECIES: hypothetical protein [unclassified Pseudomonas]|uniref:hypothetical protein n=1 Tax=unclassified Pseudomonas TaxID=196821 RepID=UPI0002D8EB28|nr:hypothetical protein [Pseudomonas sp. M47T1]